MKKQMKGALAVAILTAGIGSQAWAWGFDISSNVDLSKNDNRDMSTNQRSGRDMQLNTNSGNRTSSSSSSSNVDSRQWNTSTTDSHNFSDSRNMSTNSYDSHNMNINTGSDSVVVAGGYAPRVGSEKVEMGNFSGSGNTINNSAAGYFGVGNISNSNNGGK